MTRTEAQWIREYEHKGALWIHDGNPLRPHALFTSGLHAGNVFNSRLIITDVSLLKDAASDLFELFISEGGKSSDIDSVVGPQTGATELAHLISKQITATKNKCISLSPAKSIRDKEKIMEFNTKEQLLLLGKSVLLCEDVLTTGSSINLTVDAIVKAGGSVLPFVLVLVNRSGMKEINGRKIISLIDRYLPSWDLKKEECPLCAEGSEPIRPKGFEEWEKLNAQY